MLGEPFDQVRLQFLDMFNKWYPANPISNVSVCSFKVFLFLLLINLHCGQQERNVVLLNLEVLAQLASESYVRSDESSLESEL